jgi:hypothetical protein
MYNKHKNQTIMYQAIVDNKIGIQFNTVKKRNDFVKKVIAEGRRRITCQSNVIYPGREACLTIYLAD